MTSPTPPPPQAPPVEDDLIGAVLADLWRIAGADGHISPDEQRFIMDMVERFGVGA